MELPVRVRDADVVEVDQRERHDAAPGERLGGERPDTAHAEHDDAARHQRVQAGLADEARGAIETAMRLEAALGGAIVVRERDGKRGGLVAQQR